MTTIVHVIFNAHIDPVWLWPWEDGLDEALATCRSACDRLEAHPEIFFTQGEAWIFQQIERCDPKLFERVRAHVMSGRWETVSPWWIQPDCNQPSGFGFERQIALGKKYFQEKFGKTMRATYNVDSFGHAATLPGYLRAAGQDRYVMMRPGPHEMTLPARIFRWKGYEDGPEVTTFRIGAAYCINEIQDHHVWTVLKDVPEGVGHTMLFVGVGDHGGGATEKQIAWVKENATRFDGAKLEFSTVNRFFDAIEKKKSKLPTVVGELQHHAIGCYTVYRPIKVAVRKAEHRLRQAEIVLQDKDAAWDASIPARMEEGWQHVCFNHFHDTLGGTCLPSAYPPVIAQCDWAYATADQICHQGLRRRMLKLKDSDRQRVVLFNASDLPYEGYAEVEPWLQWADWAEGWQLHDEKGKQIPYQRIHQEASSGRIARLLFRTDIKPGDWRVIDLVTEDGNPTPKPKVTFGTDFVSNDKNVGVSLDPAAAGLKSGKTMLPLPRLELIHDISDTWSHDIVKYPEGPVVSPHWNAPCCIENGALMASLLQTGTIGDSTLRAEWRVLAGEPAIELRLVVHWRERQKILKMSLPLSGDPAERIDGIPGGELVRANDGRERPLRDFTLVATGGTKLGIVCPDVYALDCDRRRVRLSLLRAPYMAHHAPHWGPSPKEVVSDQGVHEFRFRFLIGDKVDTATLDRLAHMIQRPPLVATTTKGMPDRYPWWKK